MLTFRDDMGGTTQVPEETVAAIVDVGGKTWVYAPGAWTPKAAEGQYGDILAQMPGLEPARVFAGHGVAGEGEVIQMPPFDGAAAIRRSAVARAFTNENGTGTWVYFRDLPNAVLCVTGGF